jgi:hypothetical protein
VIPAATANTYAVTAAHPLETCHARSNRSHATQGQPLPELPIPQRRTMKPQLEAKVSHEYRIAINGTWPTASDAVVLAFLRRSRRTHAAHRRIKTTRLFRPYLTASEAAWPRHVPVCPQLELARGTLGAQLQGPECHPVREPLSQRIVAAAAVLPIGFQQRPEVDAFGFTQHTQCRYMNTIANMAQATAIGERRCISTNENPSQAPRPVTFVAILDVLGGEVLLDVVVRLPHNVGLRLEVPLELLRRQRRARRLLRVDRRCRSSRS